MNYDQARERKEIDGQGAGLWDWTTMNDGAIHRRLPCTAECVHLDQREAEEHFYNYCLSQARRLTYAMWQPCEVCGLLTNIAFGCDQLWLMLKPRPLCELHADVVSLKSLEPFTGGYQLVHS